jgi:hypothetical protein
VTLARSRNQILLDSQRSKTTPTLRHKPDPKPRGPMAWKARKIVAIKDNLPLRGQHTTDALYRRALAHAIAPH